jgi:hypothetical protein
VTGRRVETAFDGIDDALVAPGVDLDAAFE